MRPGSDDDREAATRLERIVAAHRRLRSSSEVGELFARAAEIAAEECGFDRGVVLTVGEGMLSADETGALRNRGGDRLRRQVLARPVALDAGTEEYEIVRRANERRRARQRVQSGLAAALELEHYVYAAVAPESVVLALLVLDRAAGEPTREEIATVEAFGALLAMELEHVVLRRRVDELASEVRQFATAAQALAREVRDAPVALPRDRGLGPAFPQMDFAHVHASTQAQSLFSEREIRVVSLLVEGRSNREIAELLVLSPETVKTHVARILRKLGAGNRVEAVSRYLRLGEERPAP